MLYKLCLSGGVQRFTVSNADGELLIYKELQVVSGIFRQTLKSEQSPANSQQKLGLLGIQTQGNEFY